MAIIKLTTAGESHTATITGCEVVAGKFGEQVKFDTDDGDTIYIGREPADRQLARCGFVEDQGGPEVLYGDVPGNILTFAREPNKTKGAAPYWSITVAGKADLKPKAPSKRLSGPPAECNDKEGSAFAQELRDDPTGEQGQLRGDEGREPGEELTDEAEQAKQERNAQILSVMVIGLALWDKVAAHQVAAGKADNYPVDAASISRFASTLFIEMNHRGLLR